MTDGLAAALLEPPLGGAISVRAEHSGAPSATIPVGCKIFLVGHVVLRTSVGLQTLLGTVLQAETSHPFLLPSLTLSMHVV